MCSCVMMRDKENPYDILKCSKFDSFEKIKTCHRKLILAHHPDKGEKNADQFVKIQSAFNTIRKQKENEDLINRNLSIFYNNLLPLLYLFTNYVMCKPRAIQIDIPVSLEDITSGAIKKITYKRYVRGKLTKETIYIDLSEVKSKYEFEGFGDDNPFMNSFGDVIVKLSPRAPNGYDKIDILDTSTVSLHKYIGLYEFFYGVEVPEFNTRHVPFSEGNTLIIENHQTFDTQFRINFILSFDGVNDEILADPKLKELLDKHFRRNSDSG